MRPGETELEMVMRHVRQGREHLARQLQLIQRLNAKGLRTGEAERLLSNMEDLQRLHEAHLAYLQNSKRHLS
jgi:hypothetical protein